MKLKQNAKWYLVAVMVIGTALAWADSNSGPISASDQQVQATDLVGKQAQKKVDLFTGSFTYSVPINCAPARNGSEPNLTLAYSSAGEDSWCGMGWDLEIGSIERNVRDGFPMLYGTGSPALPLDKYDDTKGFMLDLFGASYKIFSVATNGSIVEYRAETDTEFLRCFFDTTNNKWTVYDKSGNAFYFGETSGSRVSNSKTGWMTGATSTFHWALDQIVTATGDWTTIAYANNASPFTGLTEQTLYPTQINYNGHTNNNTYSADFAPPDSITFQTEVRTNDWHFSYRSGFRTELDRRLTNIVCQAGGQNVWSYRLQYGISPATARSLLTNVVVYGYSGSTATPYLTNSFAYQANPKGVSFGSTIVWTNMLLTNPGGGTDPEIAQVNSAGSTIADLVDIDGDGLPDRVIVDDTVIPNVYRVQKNLGLQSNGSGKFGTQYAFGPISTGGGNPSDASPFPTNSGYSQLNSLNGRIRDINGDGLPDRVMDYWRPFDSNSTNANAPYTNFTIAINMGTNFSSPTRWAVTNVVGPGDSLDQYSLYESVEGGGTYVSGGTFTIQVGVGLWDINGDLLPDRVMTGFVPYGGMTNLYVQDNTGGGFTPQIRLYPYRSQNMPFQGNLSQQALSLMSSFETSDSHFIDLNGDGLPDHLMWLANTNNLNCEALHTNLSYYAVEYNDGYSFESTNNNLSTVPGAADVWPGVVGQSANGTFSYNNTTYYSDSMMEPPMTGLYDLNGDGLPDRVVVNTTNITTAPPQWLVYLNNGHGFNTTPIILTNIENQGHYTTADVPWWSPEATYSGSVVTTLVDINGDGLLDRVLAVYYSSTPSSNCFLVQLNTGPYPDLLTNVNNGIGGNTAVTYASSTAYDNRVDPTNPNSNSRMPFPRQVVSTVTESDGVNAPQVTTYSYAAGYYDGPRREFHGFGIVTNTDPTLRTTVTYFHTGGGRNNAALGEYQDTNSATGLGNFAKSGMPYRIEDYGNDGALYHVEINQVDQDSLGNARYFPYTTLSFECDYPSNGTPKITATDFAYDLTTGNLTNKIEYGQVTGFNPTNVGSFTFADADGTDTRVYHTTYATINDNSYIVEEPATDSLTDTNNNVIQQTEYTYNDYSGTPASKLTLIASGYYATNSYSSYTTYGLVGVTTDPVGVQTEITYDSTYNTFPATTRQRVTPGSDNNTADFITTTTYDARSGDIIASTDPAGITVSNSFDTFLRPTETDKIPVGGGTVVWMKKYDYPAALVPIVNGIATNYTDVVVNDGVGGFTNRTYIDGFGRTLQTRIQGENNNYRVVSTAYDGRGNAFLTTWPTFGTSIGFTKPTTSQMATWTGYDAYGRVATNRAVTISVNGNGAVSSVSNSGGDTGSPLGAKTWTYVNGTDPWWVIFTDEDGVTRQYQLDAFGRTNQIIEVDGATTHSTTLKYDLADNLTNIVNANSENVYWAYNNAGDVVAMADPYLGQWTYVRDYAGRVRVQTDARGDVVSNSYVNPSTGCQDALGRMQVQTVFSFDPTNSTLIPAFTNIYVYDSSDDGNYTVYKGLLYETLDSQGWEKTGYDARARILKTTRYLDINNNDYTTAFTYNDGDKVTSTAYPNSGPTITNLYFTGGTIKQVSRSGGTETYYTVSASGYDEFGHVTNSAYGNGLTTTHAYYSVSKRLETVSAGTVFSRTFTYSPGEDILTLNGTGITNPVTVTYDNLHRIQAYTGLSGSYAYDPVGNITNNIESGSSQSYGYGVRRSQAVKLVGSARYLYDLCGNMIVRKGDTAAPESLVYDAQNRLVRFAAAGSNFMLVTFGYDAEGARLWKWNNQSPTNLQVFIGNYYEEKGGKVLFHIFANGQQVCTFETNSALYGNPGDTSHVAYYYHEDNLNSSCALSSGNSPASQQEVDVYYPFGRAVAGTLQAAFKVSRQFTGQVKDDETGLYYFNARYYDPELGRFTQPDNTIADLGNPQSYNRYSYCLNDPLRYTDPDGRAPSDWANAWSSAINRGATYVSAGPSHWIWNGTVGTVNSLVGGLAEPLRFGSTAGALSGQGHVTAKQIAIGTLQEASRAVIFVPAGAAIGKGTSTLITSLTASGEEEAVGEVSGVIGGCFVAGTLIPTENGFVEIQNVKVGDLVWSYSIQAQEWQLRPVEATPVRDYAGDVITISVDGAIIEATGNHPFWVVSGTDLSNRPIAQDLPVAERGATTFGRWVEARSLEVGDELLLLDGGTANVDSLSTRQDHLLVYNLHVTGNHTYAVSQAGVLVHNKAAQIKEVPSEAASTPKPTLSDAQSKNLARFENKLPANATPTKVFDLPSGSKAFQADSPSKNIPGSFAQYEKQVDSAGTTLQYTKTTFGPNGEIVHVKDKITGTTIAPGQ